MNANKFRYSVYHHQLPTLKALKSHCMAVYTNINLLVLFVLKSATFVNLELPFLMNRRKNIAKFDKVTPDYWKSEILYLEDGFKISEIILSRKLKILGFWAVFLGTLWILIIAVLVVCLPTALSINWKISILTTAHIQIFVRNCWITRLESFTFVIAKNHIISVFQKSDLQNLMSRTDTCSDIGKNFFVLLYDSKVLLLHLQQWLQ